MDLTPEDWDYTAAARRTLQRFTGASGMVLHCGDSITVSDRYGQWAQKGRGHTAADAAILRWMHCGANDNTDGWFLASDPISEMATRTACGGVDSQQFLAGGKGGLPKPEELIAAYNPQFTVLMLGSNDAFRPFAVAAYLANMAAILDLFQHNGTVAILSTIPPHIHALELALSYNAALRELARERRLPLIDFHAAVLALRPGLSWDGTMFYKNDVHPTGGDELSWAEPTEENFRHCGYLLRTWLSVQKIREVKERVLGP
ncbi:MAG: SGNH/GDSL hydrolase family protein [Planctomycetota bacterium]